MGVRESEKILAHKVAVSQTVKCGEFLLECAFEALRRDIVAGDVVGHSGTFECAASPACWRTWPPSGNTSVMTVYKMSMCLQ
jgi:hypothetical protein